MSSTIRALGMLVQLQHEFFHLQLAQTTVWVQGGDLRQALTQAPAQLHWYNQGASVALDIIKGLHFLHKHKVTIFRLVALAGNSATSDLNVLLTNPSLPLFTFVCHDHKHSQRSYG